MSSCMKTHSTKYRFNNIEIWIFCNEEFDAFFMNIDKRGTKSISLHMFAGIQMDVIVY